MEALPEECITYILSFMTAEEACRLAGVCRKFRSVVNSDVLWKLFLPKDWELMVSAALEPPPAMLSTFSCKNLFFRLYRHGVHVPHPIISTGKVCFIYMVNGVRKLFVGNIFFSATWELKPIPGDPLSYSEVTHNVKTLWSSFSSVGGSVPSPPSVRKLTLEKTYAIYLVFQLKSRCLTNSSFQNPVQLRFYISFGGRRQEQILILDPRLKNFEERADGWIEVEITKFTSSSSSSSIQISYHLEELPPHHYKNYTLGRKVLELRPA